MVFSITYFIKLPEKSLSLVVQSLDIIPMLSSHDSFSHNLNYVNLFFFSSTFSLDFSPVCHKNRTPSFF